MSNTKCDRRLQLYFDKHYGQFSNTIKWFADHAPNERKFFIPELEQIVTLICNSSTGEIMERVMRCKDPDMLTGPDYNFIHRHKPRKDK